MKKVLVMIAAIGIVATCTGCGKGSLSEAKLAGYDEPFEGMMEEGFDALQDEIPEFKISGEWEEGWDESGDLDEDDLDKNEEAVTYAVEQYDGETGYFYFFMVHDTKENELKVEGVKMAYGDETEEWGKSEAKEMLAEILEAN